jgi:hypothetical protein
MNKDERLLEKLEAEISLIENNDEVITEAFDQIIKYVRSSQDSQAKVIERIAETMAESFIDLKKKSDKRFDASGKDLKGYLQSELDVLKAQHYDALGELSLRLSTIKDGKDADEQMIVDTVLSKIPPPPVIEIPKESGEQVIDKINESTGIIKKERVEGLLDALMNISYAAMQSMPVTTSFFNGLRAKNLVIDGATAYQIGDTVHITGITSGGGGGSTTALAVTDLSAQANGSNKTFILPTNSSVLEVIGSDSPFIYRQGIDYTVSGTTLTFTAAVNAPSAGSTLIAEYIPAGASVAFYDLSSFTDGLTQVFAVPTPFSSITLRGSDFPFIYREGVDYTITGSILNIFGFTPSAGSTLIWDYNLVSGTATTVDLTPQVNGTNMVFTIPTITAAVALTGTDSPIVYRPGFDYVISGTTLTLLNVNPPTGTLLLTYV